MAATELRREQGQRAVPWILIAAAAALLVARIAVTLFHAGAKGAEIPWVPIQMAPRAAQSAGKPLLLVFLDDGSTDSEEFEGTVLSDRTVAGDFADYVPIRVKSTDPASAGLRSHFHLLHAPAMIITDTAGTERSRFEGLKDASFVDRFLTAGTR